MAKQPMIVDDYAAIARRLAELQEVKSAPHSFTVPSGCVIVLPSNLGYAEKTSNDLILVLNDEDWILHAHRDDREKFKAFCERVRHFFPSAKRSATRPLLFLSAEDGRRLRHWILSNLAHY